jgi:oxygen-dependent protoporphyrinogen oxidase
MTKQVAVIGGGIAGTSAANWLSQHDYDVTIIERNSYIGGRIHTQLVRGAAVEMGAGFLTDAYVNLKSFIAKHELNDTLYSQKSRSGIYRNNRVGMATAHTLFKNEVLSLKAKCFAVPLLFDTLAAWQDLDLSAFWKASQHDGHSVSAMSSLKGGDEFIEYILQPILNGYFYWTPEHTSEAMMLLLCKAAFSHGTYKMKGGLQRIPERAAAGSLALLNHTVKNVDKSNSKYAVTIECDGKLSSNTFDGIVCTTTASIVPSIFSDLKAEQSRFFESIKYSSTALMAQTYRIDQTLGNKSIAFPRKEGIDLSSVTLSPEPGAENSALATVKTYASGAVGKELGILADKMLIERLSKFMEPVRPELIIGSPDPLATHVQRWAEALPYFDVGHFGRLRAFQNGEVENPSQRITFAGDYTGGPFMEGAFTSGIRAAERLSTRIQTQ